MLKIEPGMIIEFRNKHIGLVSMFKDKNLDNGFKIVDLKKGDYITNVYDFDSNLCDKKGVKEFDVMKVYEDFKMAKIIFIRPYEFSDFEKQLLKYWYDKGFKFIRRGENHISLCENSDFAGYQDNSYCFLKMFTEFFQNLKLNAVYGILSDWWEK